MRVNKTVGRYAPSPSGRMHLGNAFTAVFAWLFARKDGGEFLLRIEDLDPDRCKAEYTKLVIDDLLWLGLDWDGEGPMQSTRSEAYEAVFRHFSDLGLVYPCYCSRAELHAASAPHSSDGIYIYPGTCRNLSDSVRFSILRKPSYRICVPDREIIFEDFLQGQVKENLATDTGDFIIRRPDGVFAYQLAVSVDDFAMGINQVVRGKDLLASTARQIWLIELLGGEAPQYCHVPLLCASDGHRLSKRNSDIDFSYIRANKSPEAVLGFLAYCAGILDRPNSISPKELLAEFQPEKLRKDDVIIDFDEWFS